MTYARRGARTLSQEVGLALGAQAGTCSPDVAAPAERRHHMHEPDWTGPLSEAYQLAAAYLAGRE